MKNLFWLDMEMSGLNPNTHRILEVALIVTDMNLNHLDKYEAVVFQSVEDLASMDPWCVKHHGKSGLSAKIPDGVPEAEVESNLVKLVQSYCNSKEMAILAGNSIHQDRKFVDRWMPQLSSLLHYRMLDISSFKIVFETSYGKKFKKQEKHRALEDIVESIEELKFYKQFITPNASIDVLKEGFSPQSTLG